MVKVYSQYLRMSLGGITLQSLDACTAQYLRPISVDEQSWATELITKSAHSEYLEGGR